MINKTDAELRQEFRQWVKDTSRDYTVDPVSLNGEEQVFIEGFRYCEKLNKCSTTKIEEHCDHTYVYRNSYANCDYYHCSKCDHIHSLRT